MASIEDIKKLLESKSFTSARDLDELEEKPDDKQNEEGWWRKRERSSLTP